MISNRIISMLKIIFDFLQKQNIGEGWRGFGTGRYKWRDEVLQGRGIALKYDEEDKEWGW